MKLFLDYETRSEVELRDIGAVKYAQDPSTEIICLGYRFENEKTKIWISDGGFDLDIYDALRDPKVEIHAHNALFETVITKFVLPRYAPHEWSGVFNLPSSRFRCTAAKAAACAIPRNLEGAAKVMRLKNQKDMIGANLLKKYIKPRQEWVYWNAYGRVSKEPQKWHDDELELDAIYEYCKDDVNAEYELDKSLPDLSPYEQKVWELNQEMNLRGIFVDTDMVDKIIKMIEIENENLKEEFIELTNGELKSPSQRDKFLKYLQGIGLSIPNLQAKTIQDILSMNIANCEAHRLLEIRQALSRTSNKKYYSFQNRICEDGRVKDLALYHGASPGRESGTGIQVHNLPKGKIRNTDFVIENIVSTNDLDFIKLCYGNAFEVFSSCIRGMVKATPGHMIFAADYNAIECRVLNWIAGNESLLNDFRNGIDPYVKMAARVLKKSVYNVSPGERQFGKTIVLACGYQMGPDRFFKTCIDWGVKGVDEKLAQLGVKIYRETNPEVVRLWRDVERAAIKAVIRRGTAIKIKNVIYEYDGEFLFCTLPSGRRIAYHKPTVKNENTPWGEMRPKLYHWHVHSQNKKMWVNSATYGGALVENICQGTARDIMVNGAMNARKVGYMYLYNVHDEIISENEIGKGSVSHFEKIVSQIPKWAEGLPVKAGAWSGPRYKKG